MRRYYFITCILFTLSGCVQPSYDEHLLFLLDVSEFSNVKSVSMRGGLQPLSWNKDFKMVEVIIDSIYKAEFIIATGYKFTEVKFIVNDTFELIGKPNRRVYFDNDHTTTFKAKYNVEN